MKQRWSRIITRLCPFPIQSLLRSPVFLRSRRSAAGGEPLPQLTRMRKGSLAAQSDGSFTASECQPDMARKRAGGMMQDYSKCCESRMPRANGFLCHCIKSSQEGRARRRQRSQAFHASPGDVMLTVAPTKEGGTSISEHNKRDIPWHACDSNALDESSPERH